MFDDIVEYHNRKPKKVLIVEDNEIESSQIAKMLETEDLIGIEIVNSGQQALELIKKNAYD